MVNFAVFTVQPDDALVADVLLAFGISDLTKPCELTTHTMAELRTWDRLYELRPRLRAVMTRARVRQCVDVMHDDVTSFALLRDFLKAVGMTLLARPRHCLRCSAGRCTVLAVQPAGAYRGMTVLHAPVRVDWERGIVPIEPVA